MRVLLVNTNLRNDVFAAPPIGMSYVATATEQAGHTVRVVDPCFKWKPYPILDAAVREFRPDVVGISIRNIDNVNMLYPVSYLENVARIVERVRQITNVPIVLGGSAPSLLPERILRLLKADYVVVADGEDTFPRLLDCLGNGGCLESIPGVGAMRDDRFVCTPPAFDDWPNGKADLCRWIDLKPYLKMGSTYAIQSKRGCRFRCIYCIYRILQGNRLRMRPPVEVVDEIEEVLGRYKPQTFEFVDSIFNDPVDHAAEILEEIARRPWKANFTATAITPRNLDAPFLDLMRRAGFKWFSVTPESASETMIANYEKGFVIDDLVRAVEAINRTAFNVSWFFMIGGPGETNGTFQESLDFVMRHFQRRGRGGDHIAGFMIGVRTYPGTKLWNIAMKDGFLTNDSEPLGQLWYLSDSLDLDRAGDQLGKACAVCPEIMCGLDEQYMHLAWVAPVLGKLFGLRQPYSRIITMVKRFRIKTGIELLFPPENVGGMLRRRLEPQRYRARPVDKAS